MEVSDEELRRLSLAGGLMARVAYVDQDIQAGEVDIMVAALQRHWLLPEAQASLVAQVAASEIGKGLDYYRLCREFFECTDEDERLRFVDVLFAVADGDGRVSHGEIEEIRTIANVQKLSHKQFIDAKLKIPADAGRTKLFCDDGVRGFSFSASTIRMGSPHISISATSRI
jgi:uncharacterized tellurite resistance protein B-like protein